MEIPKLAGRKEAMEILGWEHKSMIGTYLKRGQFPLPIQELACGPIWTVQQIEEFKERRKKS